MSKTKKGQSKKSVELIELFNDSDDELDSLNNNSCINYITDFDKWTEHHYYAMKKREKYPNMFFYYFPRSLFLDSKMTEIEKAKVIEYIFNNKNLNGKWGYLSLVLENNNISGAELFNAISNNRYIIDLSNSFPLREDAEADFDECINKKVEEVLKSKRELYNKVLGDFENYLKEQTSEAVRKKYYNFVNQHENKYIYCEKNRNLIELIDGIIDTNKNKNDYKEINDDIILLPKNYNDKNNNYNKEKNKEEDIFKGNNKIKKKKKLRKNLKLYKCDFDLDFYEENNNNNNPIIELDEKSINSNELNKNEVNFNKNIILDEDDMDNMSNSNIDSKTGKKLKKSKKLKKKDISLSSEIKYLEDYNKENYIKNESNLKNKNFNINYSTNLSSNNLLESNSNIQNTNNNNIFTPQKDPQENKVKNNIYDFNKENIEFYQNEQNLNGYTSDFTKKVYYQNEINNKIMVFSDNEDEIYLRKLTQKKKKKVTRIKANEPIIIRQKTNIQDYNDFKIIGIETSYIDKNIEKLRRGLLQKKKKIKKNINKNKRNKIINQLKKNYKEEDFNEKKYQGNYKKVIREMNNLERNKKKKEEKKEIEINDENINIDNIFSKKGNYYEIASKKKFNTNNNGIYNNKKINEYKKDRNFFNCFKKREKEDINLSDTESFLSLFKSDNNNNDNKRARKNRINNKKNKLNIFYDNSRNQNIMTFFPRNVKNSFHKDRQIMISIRKLVNNEKYNQLYEFIENDISLGARIPRYISSISSEISNNSNDINYDKINSCKNNIGQYEILYSSNGDKKNNNSFILLDDQNDNECDINKIIINNKYDTKKLDYLFKAYLEKLQIALTFLLTESKFKDCELNHYEQEKNLIQNKINFQELNIVENLMKELISNMNITPSINFKDFIKNKFIVNEFVQNELNQYLQKIENLFKDSFYDIISQIFITYLRFFISYKPKEIKLMDVKDFCFMAYTFLQILQEFLSKQKELEGIYKYMNQNNNMNISNDILNTRNLYEITNKYIKCLSLFLLNHLFIYSTNDFIPSIRNNQKHMSNNNSVPQESLILAALFKLVSSLYIENNQNIIPQNTQDNKNINDALIMYNTIFSEYLNNNLEIDTNLLGSLSEITIKDLKFYLSTNSNNCLSKEKKNLSIISNLKKAFIYNCFDIDNHIENAICIKNIINKKMVINLIQRYLYILITYFIYYGKELNCLKYFNEFYTNFNNVKNNDDSYFNIEIISKGIIDNNMKLNGNQKVKGYLVEEYLYSDIQLMNFYDRYWNIAFNDKKDFIKNYFEIMCFYKYNSRKIDNIFQKNEIQLLIDYIFEFKKSNINNKNDDENLMDEEISIDNNSENNRNNILYSIDSKLIKSLYLISESINKTLISLETNNNEDNIKKNLSKFLTISNIFTSNIKYLNSENYTLFIIPMISTILTFSQHLLKFKEIRNIEITIGKIKDILMFESSGILLKSFSLSIWINIIQKISEKNININISKYIEMINLIIRQIIQEYNKTQERGFSMQMYSNHNYNNWNNNREKEYFEIIDEYLKNIENFSKHNPDLLIKYYSILSEIHSILNIKYYYPPKMRIQFMDIIASLINHLNQKNNKNSNNNNLKNKNNDKDEDIILNEEELEFLLAGDLNEEEAEFLNFLKMEILPNLKDIIDKFISTENTNVSNKKKILYPLYEENACLYSNIFGILIKYKKIEDHLEYPRYIFNQYYNKDYEKSNIFDSVFQSIYSSKNEIGKEYYTKLPFKLFNIYLDYYNNLIYEIIYSKSFIPIIKYFMELFFIGIFINKNKKNNNMSYEEKYCHKILNIIKLNKNLIQKEKEKIKYEYKKNVFLSNENKQRISIYNLLLTLSEINEDPNHNDINNYEFNNILIGELLSKLSIDFNMDLIDSELLFELINGPKTKYALSRINKFSNCYNDNSLLYNENEINIKLYILSKYLEPYLDSKLNIKFTSYIDDFINELTGEQIISSIVTMKFLNMLLTKNNSISNKYKNCLKKVYNIFLSKAENICNIINIQNKEGQIKEYFINNEINEILLSYDNKNPNHNYNFRDSEISFHLKRNIIINFISDLPLDNLLSSNLYINLINYIISNNNSVYYNKSFKEYYGESIYYYISLCNIFNKEQKISKIKSSIELLYDVILNNNKNNNFIANIKSFYVFIFFLQKINSFINTILKIEDIENNSFYTSSLFTEVLLHSQFLLKTLNIMECFVLFMYSYIIYIIQGYNCKDRFVHSFLLKKINSVVKRNQSYFNIYSKNYNYNMIGNNLEKSDNFIEYYLNKYHGKEIMSKGYQIIDKLTNNIKIYSKNNDDTINKKIDFIRYVNFDGFQFILKNSNYK